MNKPLILVTNDDGITSKGIRTLVNLMSQIGEVMVVAPDSAQSGMVMLLLSVIPYDSPKLIYSKVSRLSPAAELQPIV